MEPIIDITDVRILSRYIVELGFESGDVRVIDLEELLDGPVFDPILADYDLFSQVVADTDAGTLVWPHGADISPRTFYRRSRPAVPSLP